jgi:subtilisin family serine protease
MARLVASVLGLAALAAIGRASAAVRLDAAFVDLLSRSGTKPHPLADASGKLPVVVELPVGMGAREMGWQPLAPGLATLRVWPSEILNFETSHPGVRFSIWPSLRPVLDESAKLNGTNAYRAALGAQGSPLTGIGQGVVVGIIDTGIDAAHPDFRDDAGNTRIAWLLDFSHAAVGKHPELEAEFGCTDPMQTPCAVLDNADIADALSDHPTIYLPRDQLGHGTHVASISAGNGGGGPTARYVGGAPGATLIIAGVTQGSVEDVADVDIATGARFIFDRADAMGLPAAVNLSLGGDFGPHDGTTSLEKALASMVGPDHPGHALVVAAGNSGVLYEGDTPEQTLGIHTQARVTHDVPARVPVLSPGTKGDAKLSGSVFVWATFGATDDISIGLTGAGGVSIAPVGVGKKAGYSAADKSLDAAIYNGVVSDDVPLTADTHGAIIIWHGKWPAAGEMALHFEGEGFVDVWMQTILENDTDEAYFEVATRQGTINVPATHPDLIAVGCTVNRTRWTDRDLHDHDIAGTHPFSILTPSDSSCYFSSAGPTATGVMKPEISAPGAMVVGAMGHDAVPGAGQPSIFDAPSGVCPDGNECFVVDATHALLSGSSMSSPQVAGAVALLLERDPKLTEPEILRLLEQGARRPLGDVRADYQLGVGALDIVGAMAAYDARTSAIARDPDAAASWMSLSSSYARPDLGSSVSGTVELRTADGAIADGFDYQRLSLDVGNGVVAKVLEREAPGLWRFEVRGLPDAGSTSMEIDVRFDGAPIGESGTRLSGHRVVPIGADRWVALGSARAYGGCSILPNNGRRWLDLVPWVVAFVVLGRKRLPRLSRR